MVESESEMSNKNSLLQAESSAAMDIEKERKLKIDSNNNKEASSPHHNLSQHSRNGHQQHNLTHIQNISQSFFEEEALIEEHAT